MENYWIDRAAIKAELEVEYKEKLVALDKEHKAKVKELEMALEEGYEEAYQMLLQECDKNNTLDNTLEVDMYEEYDKKLTEMKDYIVDKIHYFLKLEWEKICKAGPKEFADKLAAWRKALTARDMFDIAIGDVEKKEERKLEASNIRLQVEIAKLREQNAMLLVDHGKQSSWTPGDLITFTYDADQATVVMQRTENGKS